MGSLSPGWEVISCLLLTAKVFGSTLSPLARTWGGGVGSCARWRTTLPVAVAVSSSASPLIRVIVPHHGRFGWWGGEGESRLSLVLLTQTGKFRPGASLICFFFPSRIWKLAARYFPDTAHGWCVNVSHLLQLRCDLQTTNRFCLSDFCIYTANTKEGLVRDSLGPEDNQAFQRWDHNSGRGCWSQALFGALTSKLVSQMQQLIWSRKQNWIVIKWNLA